MERDPFATLGPSEVYWRDHYQWLIEQGYELRPRYRPGWVPSWHKDPTRIAHFMEDSRRSWRKKVIDAIRISDNSHVAIKRVEQSSSQMEELDILRYFSEEPQRSDPKNHCICPLDLLHPPDDQEHVLVVMPMLRMYDDPEFQTIGEGVDFLREMLVGLSFLHEHGVVHRDIRSSNYMMDPRGMYSERFHWMAPHLTYDTSKPISLFQRRHRTGLWPKYYIIDFEHSKRYSLQETPLEMPVAASDNSAPEFEFEQGPSNPFSLDVFRFGNFIHMDFITGENPTRSTLLSGALPRKGFEFLLPLVEAMTCRNPEDRVTMQQALEKFDATISQLSTSILRSRVQPRPRTAYERSFGPSDSRLTRAYWWRRLTYTLRGIPPMRSKRRKP